MSHEVNQDNKYFFRDVKLEADRQRLNLQEQTWDPFSVRHLESLGIAPGWICLNVGAGYGSITAWMADRVGPTGRVVATDIRPEVHREPGGHVEVRKHDITRDEIEKDHYDLVSCRMLLQHLKEPDKALANMAVAVKPGGWLLIEEIDNGTGPLFESKDSRLNYWFQTAYKYFDIFQKNSLGFDLVYGRRVRMILEQLGFVQVSGELNAPLSRGGEPWPMALAEALGMSFDALIGSKLVEEEEARKEQHQMQTLLADPSFYFFSAPLCSAWGRKPKR